MLRRLLFASAFVLLGTIAAFADHNSTKVSDAKKLTAVKRVVAFVDNVKKGDLKNKEVLKKEAKDKFVNSEAKLT